MDIRIGDKVRFLTETGGGKVVKLIDAKTVMVYSDDYDFEIPAAINDLVVIKSDFDTESDSIEAVSTESITTDEIGNDTVLSNRIQLAFVSKNYGKSGSDIDCYIVNDTSNVIFYTFYEHYADGVKGVSAGNCNTAEKMYLKTYSIKDIEDLKKLSFQMLIFKKDEEPESPLEYSLNLHPVKFFKNSSYKSNDYFDTPAMLLEMSNEEKAAYKIEEKPHTNNEKLTAVKEKLQEQNNIAVPKSKNAPMEVDLHIDSLIDSTVGLSSKDMLDYQLDKFHEVMETYKFRKGKKIVFIHGKGNGVLREKIVWELKRKYKKHKFQDASFQQYGFGATMVVM